MLCVWVHGWDPGRVWDGSRLALYQTLSIEYPSIFFWHMCFVLSILSFCRFCLVFVLFCFHALVAAINMEIDMFLSSLPVQ